MKYLAPFIYVPLVVAPVAWFIHEALARVIAALP